MANLNGKRNADVTNGGDGYTKRSRPSPGSHEQPVGDPRAGGYEIKSRVDPSTGQRNAFPGLDGLDGGDDPFYGPAEDGLAYLRMVRSEARTIPNVLLVPGQDKGDGGAANGSYDSWPGQGDDEGWPDGFSEDEAFIGAPDSDQIMEDGEGSDIDPQEAYYSSLLARYSNLRAMLAMSFAASNDPASSAPTDSQMHWATAQNATEARWTRALLDTSPIPAYLFALSQDDVIRGLDRLGLVLIERNLVAASAVANLGGWTWALLVQCREIGQMSSEEVSVLRVLAKKALRMGGKLRRAVLRPKEPEQAENADQDDGDGEEYVDEGIVGALSEADDGAERQGTDVEGPAPSNDATAKASHQELLDTLDSNGNPGTGQDSSSVATEDPDTKSRAIALLDIIVTIVGERYGQRDLLEQRAAW